mgnify:CR=1 FL=1
MIFLIFVVIFQNQDDIKDLQDMKVLSKAKEAALVNGSGVDTEFFAVEPLPEKLSFLMLARFVKSKGIIEYAEAAKIVKKVYPQTNFILIGPEDMSPNSFPIEEINRFVDEGRINYLGPKKDVLPFIQKCSVFVLPSYHEGMPRTVIEAMAIGRPIITTDTAGCQETVSNGINGWLVPVKNIDALVEKMFWFIENSDKLIAMGVESRHLAEKKFDVNHINADIMRVIKNS